MTMMIKSLIGGAGLVALAAAAPASAQYYYGQPNYGYGYNNGYAYNNNMTNIAAERCAAAVQNRLSYRTSRGGVLGAILGANTTGRVLNVTQVTPRNSSVRVRGLATSGRVAYNRYGGIGAYGMLGSNYQADLSFRCDVDYRGYVRNVDINRR